MPPRLSNRFNGVPTQDEINEFCNAAKNGGMSTVVTFLDKYGPAIINEKDHLKDTALTWAAWTGQTQMVALLLERGANIDVKGMRGKTALAWAAEGGKQDIVTLLLEKGAAPDLKDDDGKTALELAESRGQAAIAKQLKDWAALQRLQAETEKQRVQREKEDAAATALTSERREKLRQARPPKIQIPPRK